MMRTRPLACNVALADRVPVGVTENASHPAGRNIRDFPASETETSKCLCVNERSLDSVVVRQLR